MLAILLGGGISLLISLLGTRVAIRLFTKWGYGQEIREDGPTSHHTKRGTPTMGGVVIIASVVLGYFLAKILTTSQPSASALLLLFLFVGMGLVGFLDDFIKIYKQRNLGLRSKAKMVGQTVVAVVFGALALSPWLEDENGRTPASDKVSFLRELDWLVLPTVLALLLLSSAAYADSANFANGTLTITTSKGTQTVALPGVTAAKVSPAGPLYVVESPTEAIIVGEKGGAWRELARTPIGGAGLDADYAIAVAATPEGVYRYQTRPGGARCDGKPSYLFGEVFDGLRGR